MSRVINYNIEQEANKYVKIKIFDGSSRYQNKAIPIPKYLAVSEVNELYCVMSAYFPIAIYSFLFDYVSLNK